ncbi:hypothetical protein FOL47_000833 [Perkinsus chesapeaki]|uniref:Uncharacterized protein n=1 Tax=Perkinsus chesapeaki TaxID=330153 RepID=A0A7J6MKR1_PERCH|nr:hypothetical protein FOL47_000833 [Perkinsus chesapeaki]
MGGHEDSEQHQHGTRTENVSATPLTPQVKAIRDLVMTWLVTPPTGLDVLEQAAQKVRAIPNVTNELFGQGIDAALLSTDPHEGKVAAILKRLVEWSPEGDRRIQTPLRRLLLGDFYSPFCENPLVTKKWGSTCQERLDRVGFQESLDCENQPVVVTKDALPQSISMPQPMDTDSKAGLSYSDALSMQDDSRSKMVTEGAVRVIADNGLTTLGLEGPTFSEMVTRKDLSEGRRIALSIEPVVFSGTGDSKPYPVWKRRFDLLCRRNGLLGDPVSIFYLLSRCLSAALVLAINPSPPGLAALQGWVDEIARIFGHLSVSCSGVSDDIARLGAEQRFSVTSQKSGESVADFVVRFSNAASDLAAFTGKSVSEEKLRTNFIRGVLPVWRSVAMDVLSRGGDFITLTRELSQRERLEKVVLGPKESGLSTGGSSYPRNRVHMMVEPDMVDNNTVNPRPASHRSSKKVCYAWRDGGKCRYGSRCRFRHDNNDGNPRQVDHSQTVETVSDTGHGISSGEDSLHHIDITGGSNSLPFVSLHITELGNIPCLLDSGAFWNYITSDYLKRLGLANRLLQSCDSNVSMPNGISEEIVGSIVIGDLPFRVMSTPDGRGAQYLIMGVKSMHELGIDINFADTGDKKNNGCPMGLFTISMKSPPLLYPVLKLSPLEVDNRLSLPWHHELSTVWSPNLLEDGLPNLSTNTTGWHMVVGSTGYRWRARRLREGELRDTPSQQFCIEVESPFDADRLKKIPPRKDYGGRLVGRLDNDEKVLFNKEVEKYTQKGWWKLVGPLATTPYTSSALIVFPVRSRKAGGGTTPIRPVLDARLRNGFSPPSSYEGPCIDSILFDIRLRWLDHSRIITRDASSAFYRVRLLPSCEVELIANGMVYKSSRLCFGLRAGPCCLWSALTYVLDVSLAELSRDVQQKLVDCAFYLYLDDLTLLINQMSGATSSTLTNKDTGDALINKITEVASRYGFDFPAVKGWDSLTCQRFKHLGIWWHFGEDGSLSFSCSKLKLPNVRIQQGMIKTSWSRRMIYSVAACVSSGCDPLLIHGRQRLAGDILKILCGHMTKNMDWDQLFTLDTEDPVYKVLCACVTVVEKYTNDVCSHAVHPTNHLKIYVDASSIGWAWVMFGESDDKNELCEIQSAAGVFKANQRSYHINRKELIALSKAIFAVHNGLSGKRTIPLVCTVTICCDSQTVCRWTTTNRCSSKSLEKVAVRRLVQSIREIIDDLRLVGINVTLEKVDGVTNMADNLSRAPIEWGLESLYHIVEEEETPLFPVDSVHTVQGGEVQGDGHPTLPTGLMARERVKLIQRDSPSLSPIIACLENNDKDLSSKGEVQDKRLTDDGLLMALKYPMGSYSGSPRETFVIPCDTENGKAEAYRIVNAFHESTHHNARYLSWDVSRYFDIDGLSRMCRTVCRRCLRCQNAMTKRFYSGAMGFTDTTASCIWDVVACDLAGPFKPDKDYGFTSALVLIDMYSHFVIIKGLRDQRTDTICSALNSVIQECGIMRQLRSDGGSNLTSQRFKRFMTSHGVDHQVANRYSPFQNGMVERSISNIKTTLRLFPEVLKNKHYGTSHWYSVMSRAVRRANDRPFMGTTPFTLWFGRERRPEEVARLSVPAGDKDPKKIAEQRSLQNDEFRMAREQRVIPRGYDPRSLKVTLGQKVKVFRPNQAPGTGHAAGYYKPAVYRVVDQEGVNVTLLEEGKPEEDEIVEHIRNLRPYYA